MRKTIWHSETLRALSARHAKFVLLAGVVMIGVTAFWLASGAKFEEPVPGWLSAIFMASVFATALSSMFMLGIAAADSALDRKARELERLELIDIRRPLPGSCMSWDEYCRSPSRKRDQQEEA